MSQAAVDCSAHKKCVPGYARFRFLFSHMQPIRLPKYIGSAWRGAFGRALRDAVCVTAEKECGSCLLNSQCCYQYLFETSVEHPSDNGVNTHAPHPFVLEVMPQVEHLDGRCYQAIGINLIGRAIDLLSAVTVGLSRAGERGIAGRRNQLMLETVEQHEERGWRVIYRPTGALKPLPISNPVPDVPSEPVRINFFTPLRLMYGGRLVDAERLTPRILLHAIYARFGHLSQLHQGNTASLEPWPSIHRDQSFIDTALRWVDLDRYSSRQGRKHKIGGLMGHVTIDLNGVEEAWPLLWHGQHLHLGKLTSMGHGAYHIHLSQTRGNHSEKPYGSSQDSTYESSKGIIVMEGAS